MKAMNCVFDSAGFDEEESAKHLQETHSTIWGAAKKFFKFAKKREG